MRLMNQVILKDNRRKLRNNQTNAEYFLWLHLNRKKLGVKFRRQVSIGPFIVDFYCPVRKLIIEIDGFIHDKAAIKEDDLKRQKIIEDLGFVFLRFSNKEVLDNVDHVLEKIKNIIKNI